MHLPAREEVRPGVDEQIIRAHAGEPPTELSDGSADTVDDDCFAHGVTPYLGLSNISR